MVPPIFETTPPFIIKVFDKHFQITWNDAIEVPEDNYPYEKIRSISVKRGKEEKPWSLIDFTVELFTYTRMEKRIREYDEILIEFKTGETETRYVHGSVNEMMNEAIELIKTKLPVKNGVNKNYR